MLKRNATLLILLLLLAAGPLYASSTDAIDATDAGLKATEQSEEGQPNVPAANTWGMMLMVMLVLTASSVALLGGFPQGGGAQRVMESMRGNRFEFEPAQPETKNAPEVRKTTRSKTRRSKPKLDPEQRQLGRKSWSVSRRQAAHRPGGRRSGPGCRGIR